MRAGGFSYAGGTCRAGGSIDAEERYYHLLQRWLGDKAYDKNEDDVRSRFLMSWARGLAAMESEAIKSARESVPCLAIDALDDWERTYGVEFAPDAFKTIMRRQDFLRGVMRMQISTAHIVRIQDEVRRMVQDDQCYGWENTGATIESTDGVRYWAVLVPSYMANAENRTLYRAVFYMLRRWALAHCVPCLCTSPDAATEPAFYTDGYRGCACGKDCPGAT